MGIINRRWRSLLFPLLALCGNGVSGQTVIVPETDTQNWNDVYLSVPVAGPVEFLLQGAVRNGRDLSRPVDERVGVGFSFKVGRYLTLIPNYSYIATQPFKGRKVFENRLSFFMTVRVPVSSFTMIDRSAFERRLRRPGIDSTRYRNRLQVEHLVGPTGQKISLFVSDEVFYDWSFNAWVRNRFAVGLSKAFNKHLTGDLYFMRQNDSHSVPGDLNIFGTALRIKW
jgi:Protein of unknown function (DUF2490)